MPIGPILAQSAFDPETTSLLTSAFDTAWEIVKRSGSPMAATANAESAREELAKHIIAVAQDGERDPQRLVERALSHLTQHRKERPFNNDGGSSA